MWGIQTSVHQLVNPVNPEIPGESLSCLDLGLDKNHVGDSNISASAVIDRQIIRQAFTKIKQGRFIC